MVLSTQRGGSGSELGSGAGVDSIDECMREFISSEITHNILEWPHMIFGLVKERILKLLDVCLGAFRVEIVVGQLGAHLEPPTCGSL